MKRLFLVVFALSFAVFGNDDWKAIIMPNASMYLYCGEKFCSDKRNVEDKGDGGKLEELRDSLGVGEERNKQYQGITSLLDCLGNLPSVKDNVKSFRMCDSFAVPKALAVALEFKKPVELEDMKKLEEAKVKAASVKVAGLDALSLEPAEPAGCRFAAIPADGGRQLLLVGWSDAEALAARINPAKRAQLSPEMKYLTDAAKGDFSFCLEITGKIRQKINEGASAKMATDPLQAMAIMKMAEMKGIMVDSNVVAGGLVLKLCFSSANAQGANAFREQLLDGLVLPMAQNLADNIAPGKISTANMLASGIEDKMAVLKVNLKDSDLTIIKETMK